LNQAVMVGAGTVRSDDPELTARLAGKGRHPRPVIVSSDLDLPLRARVFKTPAPGGALVFTLKTASPSRIRAAQKAGAEVKSVKKGRGGEVDLRAVVTELGKMKIASVLLEGGAALAGSALRAGIVDEAVIFFAPKILGGGVPMTLGPGPARIAEALRLTSVHTTMAGEDLMVRGRIERG
jgi:diaminohydroxyphosphoribosylaminopyrimidine deaminase/5-amino-6-(5-phosphoribosylamino)uracil reductase